MKTTQKCLKSGHVFKRWTGKKFGVMQSLHKVIHIAVLSVAYLTFWHSPLMAQQDTIEMKEFTVFAERTPLLYSEVSRVVAVIPASEIAKAPVNSIQDLLEMVACIDVRQRGASGGQADISIRGGSFEQTLIMINGIKVNDSQTGHHNLDIPVDLDNIERIEILEGPAARVYGANAFSGAINIVTYQNSGSKIKFAGNYGDFGLLKGSLSASYQYKNLSTFFNISRKKSDGFTTNTDFDFTQIFYQTMYNTDWAKFDLRIGYTDKAFGSNSFYSVRFPNQFEQTRTSFTALKTEFGKTVKIRPVVYWRRHHDRFELFREGNDWYTHTGNYYVRNGNDTAKYSKTYSAASYYTGHNYHFTDLTGGELNLDFTTKFGKSTFGTEIRNEHIYSNVLGNNMDSLKVEGESNAWYTKQKERTNFSLFANQIYNYKKLNISAGFMANYNTAYNWNWCMGADASYLIFKDFKIIASVNQSMRLPSFTDLYYKGANNIGNPDLIPEKAISFETGIKYFNPWVLCNATVFRREGKDLIDWVKLNATDKWQTLNMTELLTNGFELFARINVKQLIGKNQPLQNFEIGYSYITNEKQSEDYISYYVLDYLKQKFTVSFNHGIYKSFGASWRILYQERAGSYTPWDKENMTYMPEVAYKPYWITDARVYWKKQNAEIYLEAQNLFNKKYNDLANIEMPGRWISFGAKFELNLKN